MIDSHPDPWLTNEINSLESSYQQKFINSKSSKIMGRKINSCHTLKIKGINNQKPNVILSKKFEPYGRTSESLSHSPIRNAVKKPKPAEKFSKPITSLVSSPLITYPAINEKKIAKDLKELKENYIKLEKNKQLKTKKKFTETLPQPHHQKLEILGKTSDEKTLFDMKKLRGRNSIDKMPQKPTQNIKISETSHQKPWGTSKIISKEKNNLLKSSGEDEIKIQTKADREASRKISRKKIGLEFIKNFKALEKKPVTKEEITQKAKRVLNSELQNYLKEKKKKKMLEKITKKIEEDCKEKDRVQGLETLEKVRKIKKSKRKNKNKLKQATTEKDKAKGNRIIKSKRNKKCQDMKLKFSSPEKLIKNSIGLNDIKKQLYIETCAARRIQR